MAQYSIQKVPMIIGRDKVTKEPQLTLKWLKDLTFTNGSETVALTQDGTPLTHFEHSKAFGIAGSNATIDDFLMSMQLGTDVEVITTTTEIKITETVTSTIVDELTVTYQPTGTTDAEILWAELLDADGSATTIFEQAAAAAAGKFSMALKVLTFDTGELPIGSKVRVSYFPTTATARKIQNIASNYVTSLDWDIHARFKDVCSSEEVLGYIHVPSGFLSGAFEWATTEGGDPAIQNFELMAEKTCSDDELYTVYFYDVDDLT